MLGSTDEASTSEVRANMSGIFLPHITTQKGSIKWILETGVINHMPSKLECLHNVKKVNNSKVFLPNRSF